MGFRAKTHPTCFCGIQQELLQYRRPLLESREAMKLAMGVAMGIAIGAAMGNVGLGVVFGAALGAAFAGASRRKDQDSQ